MYQFLTIAFLSTLRCNNLTLGSDVVHIHIESKKISNDQELIQSDPISCQIQDIAKYHIHIEVVQSARRTSTHQ